MSPSAPPFPEDTPERRAWVRIHPDAAQLFNVVSNLTAREGWDDPEQMADRLARAAGEAQALAARCDAAGVRRISPTGDVLPSWAMVAQLLARWSGHDDPARRVQAAERTLREAHDAANLTAAGRLNGEPWPEG